MDDDGAGGATACGLFELVGPASVVGHRPTTKQCRIPRGESGVVDEDYRGLAAHVDAGVIVPSVFGRRDSMSYEHHRARSHRFDRLHAFGPDDHVVAKLEIGFQAGGRELQRGVGARGDFDHGHFLQIARPIARLQSQPAKFRFEVVERALLTLGSRFSAAEFVGCQPRDVRAVGRFLDRTALRGCDRRDGTSDQQGWNQVPERALKCTHAGEPQDFGQYIHRATASTTSRAPCAARRHVRIRSSP